MEKPLLSFIILTYNQQAYIKEAIEGVLAQTYHPLEIIISDDCSTDKTFEIVSSLVDNYVGNHKIIINRNKRNIGISKHVDKAVSLASGELLIMGAGDDISLSDRVATIYSCWYQNRNKVYALVSSNITMNEDGSLANNRYEIHEDFIENNIFSKRTFCGACTAYSPDLFKIFGSMDENVYEDMVLFRRALMLGSVYFIKKPLVKYRLGGISNAKYDTVSANAVILSVKKNAFVQFYSSKQMLDDALHIGIRDEKILEFFKICNSLERLKIRMLSCSQGLRKCLYLLRIVLFLERKSVGTLTFVDYLKLILTLFPRLLDCVLKLRHKLESSQ